MIEQYIQKININPFIGGCVIQSFYDGYEKDECPLLLHYIILPIILYGDTRKIFESINKTSSLPTIVLSNQIQFIGLQERVENMRELTNISLINLHNNEKIILKKNVQIIETIKYENYKNEFSRLFRASHYLGKIIRDYQIQEVCKIIKVIP